MGTVDGFTPFGASAVGGTFQGVEALRPAGQARPYPDPLDADADADGVGVGVGAGGRPRVVRVGVGGKAAADYAMAAALLVLTLPLVALCAGLVRLTSRGPAIYRQARVGRGGRVFVIYKLRTMRDDCERETGPRWAGRKDGRVTWLGRALRATHVDELPQLWNILRGDMSLIGPRPERPEIVARLELVIPHYRDRESVLPGITGLAQVQLPPDVDLGSVRRKLACDLYYVKHAGPWLDLRILAGTALKVLGVPFWASCRALGIPSGPAVEALFKSWPGPRPAAAAPHSPPS